MDINQEALKHQFNKVSTPDPFTHEYLDKRIVRINGPITDEVAMRTISMMETLNDIDPTKDIELRINSPGGSVTAGLAIYDAMKNMDCDIKTVCEGQCASMGAILLSAGTPGKRFAMPSSTIMIHDVSGGITGKYEGSMKVALEEVSRLKGILVDIVSSYTGQTPEKCRALMDRDNFMSPTVAVTMGFIDAIIPPKHKPPVLKVA